MYRTLYQSAKIQSHLSGPEFRVLRYGVALHVSVKADSFLVFRRPGAVLSDLHYQSAAFLCIAVAVLVVKPF